MTVNTVYSISTETKSGIKESQELNPFCYFPLHGACIFWQGNH